MNLTGAQWALTGRQSYDSLRLAFNDYYKTFAQVT